MNKLLTKCKHSVVKVMMIAAAVLTVTVASGTSAHAATTPYCAYHNYVFVAVGGCDGVGGPGHDRMWLRCRVNNTGYWTDRAGNWHDRYSSWQETRSCLGGEHVWQVWFEHKNN